MAGAGSDTGKIHSMALFKFISIKIIKSDSVNNLFKETLKQIEGIGIVYSKTIKHKLLLFMYINKYDFILNFITEHGKQ